MNEIHPTAILSGDVAMGSGNLIGPGVRIVGPITIGDGNYIGAYTAIGVAPHDEVVSPEEHWTIDQGLPHRYGSIALGSGNVIRDFCSVQRGLTGPTVIGDGCYIMAHTTVSHDSVLRDGVKITSGVQIGGYCRLGRGSYLGLSSAVHQFTVIGGHSIIGMGAAVVENVVPGAKAFGVPARVRGCNSRALDGLGIANFDWWGHYVEGEANGGCPEELRQAVTEYREDCIWARSVRQDVTAFRS